jgi:hypothetical protein
MTIDIERFFSEGSAFVPPIIDDLIRKIVAQRHESSEFETMQFTIANALVDLPAYYVPLLMTKLASLNKQFGTVPLNLEDFMKGFLFPIMAIQVAEVAQHIDRHSGLDVLAKLEGRIKQELEDKFDKYNPLVAQDPTYRELFLWAEKTLEGWPTYFQVGCRAAKIAFIRYSMYFGADFS